MNEERGCVVLTEANGNNGAVVGSGLFVWRRTERRPLDLRPLRFLLWDVTSFPSWNAQNVQGVCLFVFPLFLSVEKQMGKTSVRVVPGPR